MWVGLAKTKRELEKPSEQINYSLFPEFLIQRQDTEVRSSAYVNKFISSTTAWAAFSEHSIVHHATKRLSQKV